MDPEIQKALAAGYTPQEIAQELQSRGLPVPPELFNQPQPFADLVNQGAGAPAPAPGGPAPSMGGASAAGLGAVGAGTLGYWRFAPKSRALRQLLQATQGQSALGNLQDTQSEIERTGRGGLATLGDLTDELRAMADFTATSNPSARGKIGRINEARRMGVPGRVQQDITDLAGYAAPRQEIAQTAADKAAFAASDAGFEGLRQANPVLKDPAALGLALQAPDAQPLRDVYAKARATDLAGGGTGTPSFRTLQQMKRDLDQRIQTAFASGNGDLGNDLKKARSRLFDIMEQQVGPQYQQAVQTYRKMSALQEAQQSGLDLWNNRQLQLDDIQAQMKGMSPEELNAYRRGVTGGLLTQVQNAKTNTNLANQLLNESAANEKKMELIFGSRDNFEEFMKRMKVERLLSQLGETVGNSATARRYLAAEAGGPVEGAVDAAHMALNPVYGTLSAVGRRGPGFFARRMAAQLEPYFTAQGPELQKLLQNLESLRP